MNEGALPNSTAAWHRRIWQLTWPIILANVTIPLVGVTDVAVMGRMEDPVFIAAVAMGSAMFSAVYWLFGFLRMGTTGLSSQAYGREDIDEVVRIFIRASAVAAALGLAIVSLQLPLASLLFELFDAGERLGSYAEDYYFLRIYGAPALLLYLVELGILFGLQRTRDTLLLSVGLNLTNLVLDVVLVLVFDLGVTGVAAGTLVSEWLAALFGLLLIARAMHAQGWSWSMPANLWQRQQLATLFHVSGNLVLRTFFVQLPFFTGTVIATRIGDVTLAAHGVLMQLFFVMTYSLDGFAHTAETMAGYAYGARQPLQMRRATAYNAMWAMALAVLTGAAYLLLGTEFIALLTVSDAVRSMAGSYLVWIAVAPLVCIWAFLFDGIFIGTTHIVEMRNGMLIAAAVWALTLWATLAAQAYLAVWISMTVFMLVRSVVLACYYPRIERNAASET